jgi:hypothetical protein
MPLSLATFEPLVGTTFSVEASAGGSVGLQLRSVEPASGGSHGFSLLFAGPHFAPLAQGTYPFTHTALGTYPIFIVPVAREPGAFVYEAVFT